MADFDSSALNASATARLRDTAKWLVGGVTATAVGILAGSSLTRLGSLDFVETPGRLSLVIAGAALGFGGLAWILDRALAVVTVESFSFETFVRSGDPQHEEVRDAVAKRLGRLPGGVADLDALLAKVEAARKSESDPESNAFLEDYRTYRAVFLPEVAFANVKAKFDRLIGAIRFGTPVAILGLGLYAWAANPPEPKPAAAGPGPLVVIGPQTMTATQTARTCPPARLRHCPTPTPEPSPLIDK